MKKFKFSLESSLSLRRFRKQEAAIALAKATHKRSGVENRLRASEGKLSETQAQAVPGRGERVTANEMLRRQASIAYYRNELKRIGEQYQTVLELEDLRYRELMDARQEEGGLLRLKEKAKEIYQVELIRSDELAVQEFVNARRGRVLA
jgi:flagellar export protein FliJ